MKLLHDIRLIVPYKTSLIHICTTFTAAFTVFCSLSLLLVSDWTTLVFRAYLHRFVYVCVGVVREECVLYRDVQKKFAYAYT